MGGVSRGNRFGLVVTVAALLALVGVVVHGSPKPAVYASTDPLAGQTLYQAPAPPAALWVGDSYAAGGGADVANQAFPETVSHDMGWICNLDAEPGTGFVNDGHGGKYADPSYQPYLGRLATDGQKFKVDLLIVTGGRNDFDWSTNDAAAAARSYLLAAHAQFPKARLVIVAPFWMDSHPVPQIFAERDAEKALAASLHAVFIDPLAEQWMTDQTKAQYLSSDGVHPNQAGHDYLARRLTADLRTDHV
jgi:lysophospholipase L1-like esterase